MNLKEQAEEILQKMKALTDRVRTAGRDFTNAETTEYAGLMADFVGLQKKLENVDKSQSILNQILSMGSGDDGSDDGGATGPRYLNFGMKTASRMAQAMKQRAEDTHRKSIITPDAVTSTIVVDPEPVQMGRAPLTLLAALPARPAPSPVYGYSVQTVFTPNAEIVPWGAQKPTTVTTITPATNHLRTIANLSEPVPLQLLEDNSYLATFLSQQLVYAVQLKLEDAVVNGTGEGEDMLGLLNAPLQEIPFDTDPLVTLRNAQTPLEALGFSPSVYALNPLDWQHISTARLENGEFDLGPGGAPVDAVGQMLWGVRLVSTPALPEGTALCLDVTGFTVKYGSGFRTTWDTSGPLFDTNQTKARTEGRFAFDISMPQKGVIVSLTAAAPGGTRAKAASTTKKTDLGAGVTAV